MNKLLIIQAFEKAKLEKIKSGANNPSQTDLAETLSQFIEDVENFSLGERTYRDYYNAAKKIILENDDIAIKQIAVINGLCKYLNFNDYQTFLNSIKNNKEQTILEKAKNFISGNRAILGISTLLLIAFVIYYYTTRQRWMIWEKNQYIEVEVDAIKYDVRLLKFYKSERIKDFKKIDPKCAYTFFNADGSVRLWYGKNKNKVLEYFTGLGLHPETGKTLKPITQYMINKYICQE
jgi:hypothetical protein